MIDTFVISYGCLDRQQRTCTFKTSGDTHTERGRFADSEGRPTSPAAVVFANELCSIRYVVIDGVRLFRPGVTIVTVAHGEDWDTVLEPVLTRLALDAGVPNDQIGVLCRVGTMADLLRIEFDIETAFPFSNRID